MALADKEKVRERARALGFEACGFTSAAPLDCGPVLEEWIRRGRHGSMAYLAKNPERRISPAAQLPDARTVIVALRAYQAPRPPRGDWRRSLFGRIASYALGPDYHDDLGERMTALGEGIRELHGAKYAVHVDAGPLVEKDLARRAGLGWYGRNTNILTTGGSYFLIACLITDAEYEPDPPMTASHCGTCTACIPACPTGALDHGPTIDAARCISYLTIEHHGPFTNELQPLMNKMENWVFGCDVCQEVCPWHDETDAENRGDMELGPGDDPLYPDLPGLLKLDRDAFHDRYRRTAVWRTKRRGLARNAVIALGNSGNPLAAEPLREALRDHDEPLVRYHAAGALAGLPGATAAADLARALAAESVAPVRREIERVLENPLPHGSDETGKPGESGGSGGSGEAASTRVREDLP